MSLENFVHHAGLQEIGLNTAIVAAGRTLAREGTPSVTPTGLLRALKVGGKLLDEDPSLRLAEHQLNVLEAGITEEDVTAWALAQMVNTSIERLDDDYRHFRVGSATLVGACSLSEMRFAQEMHRLQQGQPPKDGLQVFSDPDGMVLVRKGFAPSALLMTETIVRGVRYQAGSIFGLDSVTDAGVRKDVAAGVLEQRSTDDIVGLSFRRMSFLGLPPDEREVFPQAQPYFGRLSEEERFILYKHGLDDIQATITESLAVQAP